MTGEEKQRLDKIRRWLSEAQSLLHRVERGDADRETLVTFLARGWQEWQPVDYAPLFRDD